MDDCYNYERANDGYYEYTKELPKRKYIKSRGKRLIEIDKAISDGNYTLAYDLADSLINDIDKYDDVKNPDVERERIRRCVIFNTLEAQYTDSILQKYNQMYNDIIKYDSVQNYKSSGYPGTIKEYARNKTIEELMSLYRKSRYGGYMHTIVMRVIRKYIDQIDRDSEKQVTENMIRHEEIGAKGENASTENYSNDEILNKIRKSFMQER